MNTPRTDSFAQAYVPLTVESCLAWARQIEAEQAELRAAVVDAAESFEAIKRVPDDDQRALRGALDRALELRQRVLDLATNTQTQPFGSSE